MLTLAVNLYSVRLAIKEIQEQPEPAVSSSETTSPLANDLYNKLNNHLMAITGTAELTLRDNSSNAAVRDVCHEIIRQSEQAANLLQRNLPEQGTISSGTDNRITQFESIQTQLENILTRQHISDRLFMYGGSPREIMIKQSGENQPVIKVFAFEALIDEALNRFCSLADDDDVITITAYSKQQEVYVDISRHHKNFPPVDAVAGFGQFYPVGEVLTHRPADRFLEHIKDQPYYYAYDRLASRPTYISFRFPLLTTIPATNNPSKAFKILAIDDQPVILDLLTAMCQTSGYSVVTASSGEEGLKKAREEHFNLILTDLAMPGLSGLEVAREIKKSYPELPIVLITGWGVTIDKSQLESCGITTVLYKPFKIEQLSEIIEHIRQPQ